MILSLRWWRKGAATVLAMGMLSSALAGCNGPTVVEQAAQTGNYKIEFSMDPELLNPPQFATLSYGVKDEANGKPVADFDMVNGALFHNVIISRDLASFKHTYTSKPERDAFSMLTQFTQRSKYYSYTIFKPSGGDTQVLEGMIESGSEGDAANLTVDATRHKTAYGVTFDLLTGTAPLKAGQHSQIGVYITEHGNPVRELWPFLGAPGYLWVIGADGQNFGWETGASEGRPIPGSTEGKAMPAPTLVPGLNSQVKERAAQPVEPLAPVQQTALVSVLETPGAVVPGTAYGPLVAYTHTFPKAGLYKIWSEVQYRGQVLTADWVVEVAP